MTRYMFYFHYWLSSEPIKAVIDFDPRDKAKILIEEIYEEITYHIGDEPNPGSLLLVEMFGLRPFNPVAWEMNLDQFVGNYGNEFVVFDLEQPIIGNIENFRPKQIEGGQRNKFYTISVTDNEWDKRAKFETRLVSALIRYFQFYKKTKWMLVLPLDGIKNNHRLWKVTSAIPETNYTAEWRIILPDEYPEEPPKLFIRKIDYYVAESETVDLSLIWKDPDGTEFYYISEIDYESTKWEENHFLVDFLLTGFWNYLVRTLKSTFSRLYFYKVNISRPSIIKDAPKESTSVSRQQSTNRSLDEDYEEEPDWRVQITEVMEDIVYDQQTMDSKIEEDPIEASSFESHELEEAKNKEFSDEKKIETKLQNNDQIIKENGVQKSNYSDWVMAKNDQDELNDYALMFTWLLQRVPDHALKELQMLKDFDESHEIFNLINWRLVKESISESKLSKFAPNIVNFYINLADIDIFDTDREFLREVVLKKWKDIENVPKLRELLKQNVKKIKKVNYLLI